MKMMRLILIDEKLVIVSICWRFSQEVCKLSANSNAVVLIASDSIFAVRDAISLAHYCYEIVIHRTNFLYCRFFIVAICCNFLHLLL